VQEISTSSTTDLIYAQTRDGLDLPIIDLTSPRFAIADDTQSYEAHRDAFLKWNEKRERAPKFLMRLVLWRAAQRSLLMRALFKSDRDFLDSISTYILKLGPNNLPAGFDGPMDKQIAASPHVVLIRLRMQQVAKLLANALVPALSADPGAPLALINIAGGPALDSINVVLLLNSMQPALLNRAITIHVLDAHEDGPLFGANALAAMKQPGAPLHGIDVKLQYHAYDWNQPIALAYLVSQLKERGEIIAASSEGGLFEYGSDEAIVGNLNALAAKQSGARFVAGSVTGASDYRKRMIAETRFKLYPRGLDGFEPLAKQAGYTPLKSEPNVLSDQVLLGLAPA